MFMNPNHPTSQAVRDQWRELCVLVMRKCGVSHVLITEADVLAMGSDTATSVHADWQGVHLSLHTTAEAEELARKEGGLPA